MNTSGSKSLFKNSLTGFNNTDINNLTKQVLTNKSNIATNTNDISVIKTDINNLQLVVYYPWKTLINQPNILIGTNELIKTDFQGNITQSTGSCQFNDSTIGTITQSNTSVIVQTGTQWNLLKSTQITNLEVTTNLTLPPNITIAGSSYTDDIILNEATLQQTVTDGGINTLTATDFYNGDVRFSNNLSMIGGAETTASLKNLSVIGTSSLGLITGSTISDLYGIKANKLNDTLTGSTIVNSTFTGTVSGLTKSNVGLNLVANKDLSNCDNTSDVLKPISTATSNALLLKANLESPTFTGTSTFNNITSTGTTNFNILNTTSYLNIGGAVFSSGYLYNRGIQTVLPAYGNSNPTLSYNQSIGVKPGNTHISYMKSLLDQVPANKAFNWELMTSSSTFTELMNIKNNGDLNVTGTITSPTITTINSNLAGALSDLLTKQNTLNSSNRLDASNIATGIISNTEFNYLDNVTSNIQTQINSKQNTLSLTNRLDCLNISTGIISNTEFNFLDNVTSNIQTQINSKQNTLSLTNLLDASFISTGIISNIEFDYLNGVTSNIQTQLNNAIHSVSVGTASSLPGGSQPIVTNSGTTTDLILNFQIASGMNGADGAKGDTGDKGDKGNTGDTGPPDLLASGLATAAMAEATAALGVAGTALTTAGGALTTAGTAITLANAAQATADGAVTSINSVESQIVTINSNIDTLQNKTQFQTATASTTTFTSDITCNDIMTSGVSVNGALYSQNNIYCTGEIRSNDFRNNSGFNTNIHGENINIGTSELLVNYINIGNLSSIIRLNGLVTYANPFDLLDQWG